MGEQVSGFLATVAAVSVFSLCVRTWVVLDGFNLISNFIGCVLNRKNALIFSNMSSKEKIYCSLG